METIQATDLKLKRGSGKTFEGQNWQSVKEDKWEQHMMYVPSGQEKYMGSREIDGTTHAVFQCLDDSFLAQPVSICELPTSEDPLKVIYQVQASVKTPEETVRPNDIQPAKTDGTLVFIGKNWKLSSDKKWKKLSGFVPPTSGLMGKKTINNVEYEIHRTDSGFLAVKE